MPTKNKAPKQPQAAPEPTPVLEPAAASQPAAVPDKTISVPLDQWQSLVETVDELKRKNAVLYEAADRARVNAIEGRNAKPLERFVKLRTLEVQGVRKVILGWRMVRDHVFKAANGAWVEDQVVEVIFEDDTRQELSLVDFTRKTDQGKLKARIIEHRMDEQGRETLRLACDDNVERLVGITFVN